MTRPPIIGIVLFSLAPCISGGGQSVRDSAGVRITLVNERTHAARISLNATPRLDIGGGNDERSELHQAGDVRALSDGTIVVADRSSAQLKFFAPDGRYLRSAGRKGTGPGEFEFLAGFWVTGEDSIVAADGTLRRVVVFDRDGRHVRTVTIETPANRRTPRVLALLPPSLLLGGSSDVTSVNARAEPYYFTQVLYILDLTGRVQSRLGTFVESEHFVQVMYPGNPERGNSYWNLAFGRNVSVRAFGGSVAVGDGSSMEVRLYSSMGQLTGILRGTQDRVGVTPQDKADFKARTLAASASSLMKPLIDRMVAEMPFPDRFPAYERFETDPLDRIWLKRYARPSDSTEVWTALTKDGSFLGAVELPPRARLRSITSSEFLCVWRDADDVERVRSYAFAVIPTTRRP